MIAAIEGTQPITPVGLRIGYPILSSVFQARGWESLRNRPAVLVYQMAKVGSMTVVRSLRGSRPRPPIFHVHTLTGDGINAMERFYRWSRVPSLPAAGHLLVSRYLRHQLELGVTPGRWKVVTMVRDPIARNISLIFQLGRRLIPDFRKRCDTGRLDPIEIFDAFGAVFPSQVDCFRWFREELHAVFGVNPLAESFDVETGCQVYRGPFADVLLIRTEDLDRSGPRALKSFLGLRELPWGHANLGARKANGTRYTDLLARIGLPREYVDRFYDAPEVRHFYTPAELDRFRARWCGTPGGAS